TLSLQPRRPCRGPPGWHERLPGSSPALVSSNNKNGDTYVMTHAVDRRPEDQVFQALVAMRSHDKQIRLHLIGHACDLAGRAAPILNANLRPDAFFQQTIGNLFKIVLPFRDLGGGCK